MNDLKKWYFSQTSSSQVLVALATLMVVVFIAYEYLIFPWKQNLDNLRQSVENDTFTAAWMETEYQNNQSLIAQSAQKTTTQTSEQSLIAQIEQSAKKQNLFSNVERISPDRVGRVKVWLNNADFYDWLAWVVELKQTGVDVVEARVGQVDKESPVTINVTFTKPTQ